MTAIRAFYNAFTDPGSQLRDMTREARVELYAQAWGYYRSTQFSRRNGADWSAYLAYRDLYKHTRLIYNPVPMVVDFYVDNLWQPAMNEEFPALTTPLVDNTDETLVTAIAQLDQWGVFLSESQKIKRYGAATGNVLIEGIDDLERGKILHRTIWPGFVSEIELNSSGDVRAYVIEYPVFDTERKTTYQFRKQVTTESIAYFRDDKPFVPPGVAAPEVPNPYGFCFAVWIRHTDDGADYGIPAFNDLDKVDNLNSLASHLDDHIHKAIESPKIIGADGEVVPIIGATRNDRTKQISTSDPRLHWVVLKANSAVTVADLSGAVHLAEAHPYLKDQLAAFTDAYPELQASSIIQKNSQLSGAALERMLGPAQNRLDGVQAGYNAQLIKLRQMQLAIGGMRANGGGWQNLNAQQQLFKPFNLKSYGQGDLDFNLKRSVLVGNTVEEVEDLLKKKADRAVTLQPFIDQEEALRIAGYTEEEIESIMERFEATDDTAAWNGQGLPPEQVALNNEGVLNG